MDLSQQEYKILIFSFFLQLSDQDSSSASASVTEEELEGDMDEEVEGEEEEEEDSNDKHRSSPAPSLSSFSSSLRAVIRIKQKYQAMKKRRQELALSMGGAGGLTGAPSRTSPKIFTFDPSAFPALTSSVAQKKKKRRRRRVLFPNSGGPRAPPKQEQSRAKYCLYLLFAIVFIQVQQLNTTVTVTQKLSPDWIEARFRCHSGPNLPEQVDLATQQQSFRERCPVCVTCSGCGWA